MIVGSFDYFRYSSCIIGSVSADALAVGPLETWIVHKQEQGFIFESATYQSFMQAVEDPLIYRTTSEQSAPMLTTAGSVRGDSRSAGFRESWQINCQSSEKKKRLLKRLEQQKKKRDNAAAMELEELARMQSGTHSSQLQFDQEGLEAIAEARAHGNLHEALLERRSKIKSDRYCK